MCLHRKTQFEDTVITQGAFFTFKEVQTEIPSKKKKNHQIIQFLNSEMLISSPQWLGFGLRYVAIIDNINVN